jgi:hypothetical protein
MSLYLCVFDGGDELAGVEVGSYADFNALRAAIAREFEGGAVGSKFPELMLHSDCDGEWSVEECARLREELRTLVDEARNRPALFGSFLDVDGRPLLESLLGLAEFALRRRLPILFQ